MTSIEKQQALTDIRECLEAMTPESRAALVECMSSADVASMRLAADNFLLVTKNYESA